MCNRQIFQIGKHLARRMNGERVSASYETGPNQTKFELFLHHWNHQFSG
jgi:hypothetical protein